MQIIEGLLIVNIPQSVKYFMERENNRFNKEVSLFRKLSFLDLPLFDFAVFGSAPMVAHGLKRSINDLDVIARKSAWEKAKTFGTPEVSRSKFGSVISLMGGAIEVFDQWPPEGKWNIDKLIDEAEIINGLRFVRLEVVVEWKRDSSRRKDLEDITQIENFLRRYRGDQ